MELIEPRIWIENRTFDEIEIGESAALQRTLTHRDIQLFAVMSGDVNPAHLDADYAHGDMFHKIIAHGMWGASLISTLLGTTLPGPGTIYLEQTLRFLRPVGIGDTVTVSITAVTKQPERHRIAFDCRCVNQRGDEVIAGTATVIAPTEKVRRPRVVLPEVVMRDSAGGLRELLAQAKSLAPVRTAVVHPVDRDALLGALQAAQEGLIVPLLVGPQDRIRATAQAHELDIAGLTVIDTEHSHQAADTAVRLARGGRVDALMKGSLHTDELMDAVCAGKGLATDRCMSHVFVMDVPTYPRPLLITDAAFNVAPNLETKRDIVQNAIDLALAIGVSEPKVAILSAVETVNPKLRSSLDAAALAKMAERGQIHGGVVDGPLGFDSAISPAAALVKGIASPVAGRADIVVVPDIDSGNLLVKQLDYLGDSQSAGIVLAGRVPIALASRADSAFERVASAALAVLMAHAAADKRPLPDVPGDLSAAGAGFDVTL
ncbi:MAG: bifunctional enoyl-CoA hydratase/phosphate acetyltransferase [Solirubrobacteraceae bacterium]|jgi:phosphotransacetylase/acyl dehydratase